MKLPDYNNRLRILVATYVTFSPDGTELLVNMGGEQVIRILMKWGEKRLLSGLVLKHLWLLLSRFTCLIWHLSRGPTLFYFQKSAKHQQVRLCKPHWLSMVLSSLEQSLYFGFPGEIQNGKTTNGISNGLHFPLPTTHIHFAERFYSR